jgi:hypothetical protein
MLERLQQQLNDTYQSDHGYDVRDFLVTDARIAKALSADNVLTNSGETLLVCEEDDGLALTLYLEAEILKRLESADPLRTGKLDDLCKVIEGLSHFNYVIWRAHRDRSMSLFELELQAEVDKFVSTMELAREKRDHDLLNGLHGKLFDNPRFSDDLDEAQLERYRAATEYAARFCRGLRDRLLQSRDSTLNELRHFYRLPLNDKISHIHTRAWIQ